MKYYYCFCAWTLCCFGFLFSQPNSNHSTDRPNILFIAIDDLRPQLKCYGETYMHTPHLDSIAAEGRLFNHHYVQVPTCGASRYSLLMGQYPQQDFHLNNQVFRDHLQEAKAQGLLPLPQVFKSAGYYTASLGKISHYVDGKIFTYEGEGDGRWEMPDSWDKCWGPVDKWGTAWNAFFGYADGSNRNGKHKQGSPTEFIAADDEELPDGIIAREAVKELHQLKHTNQPFFLAVGFFKPHLPFVAPKRYWDLYEGKALPLSPSPDMPLTSVPPSVHSSGEMFNNYQDQPEKGGRGIRLSDEYALQLRRAYFAAVSYADAQVGKLMKALKETGLEENTIVVVWGDHGWHLGDHTVWGKHTLFERSLRSTLMIKTPHMSAPGTSTDAIVETVDIYPTLLELCEIEAHNELSGKSLLPVLKNPSENLGKAALGYWKGGISMRTEQYRLTKWKAENEIYTELYDHQKDRYEMENVAGREEYQTVLKDLEQQLQAGELQRYWTSLK